MAPPVSLPTSGDVLEVQRRQEVADQPRDAAPATGRRRRSSRCDASRAGGRGRCSAASPCSSGVTLRHSSPSTSRPWRKTTGGPVAGVAVVDGPLRQRDLGHVVLAIALALRTDCTHNEYRQYECQANQARRARPRPPAPRSSPPPARSSPSAGYAAVGTEEIVRAAGVTRGALYHQFADKRELFAAVFEQVEAEVTQRTARAAVASGAERSARRAARRRRRLARGLQRARGPAHRAARRPGGPRLGGAGARSACATRSASSRTSCRRRSTPAASRPSRSPPSPTCSWAPSTRPRSTSRTADDQDAARAEVGAVLDRLFGSLA